MAPKKRAKEKVELEKQYSKHQISKIILGVEAANKKLIHLLYLSLGLYFSSMSIIYMLFGR